MMELHVFELFPEINVSIVPCRALASVGLKAWLEMVNLEQEIKARGRKPAFGPMSTTRNRRILAQAVEDEDTTATEVFQASTVSLTGCCWCCHESSFFASPC